MAELQKLRELSAPHCILLAAHYATESNIRALRALTALRDTDFDLELVLQLLLTYFPESTESTSYAEYLHELVTDSRTPGDDPAAVLDTSPVGDIGNSQARKRRQKLELLPLAHPLYRTEKELDPLSHFLMHRAHRIDAATGMLDVIPQLIVPFLNSSEFLRTWFISTVLPLLRLGYEYYPQSITPSLDEFARMKGKRAIEQQLSHLRLSRREGADTQNAARDLRGVVGPWICGANERKRRKLGSEDRTPTMPDSQSLETDEWECLFDWLMQTSKEDLPLVSSALMEWDGPEDMDLGGLEEGRDYVDDETQRRVELRYAQTVLACLYLVENNDQDTIRTVHSLLERLSDLLNFDLPPDLNSDINSLPSFDLKEPVLQNPTTSVLQDESLMRPDNVLTQPTRDAVRLLELFTFSICLLSSLHNALSLRELARLHIRSDASEQMSLLQKILHSLSSGSKRDNEQWVTTRSKILWLWSWGSKQQDDDRHAPGIFGKITKEAVEIEILKALLGNNAYQLAAQIYIQQSSELRPLLLPEVEKIVLTSVMHHYDNASNGNRTRGGMKRASDMVAAFNTYFSSSARFKRTQALLSATHAMSFYSLTLQHGVPFQPVNIRVSTDPLSLLQKLLSQNSRSYTHLDDLISIGQNLIISSPSTIMDDESDDATHFDDAAVEQQKSHAERRVIGMAIEASLEEDDFETAYSYVMNRLRAPLPSPAVSVAESTSSQDFFFDSFTSEKHDENADDISWRAALHAGRYQSSATSSTVLQQAGTTARPDLRRLEQRMELLSQALLLAPPPHLEEVLAVWQQCETEMTTLLAQEHEAEERFNDAADRRLPGAFLNETAAVQPRREVGRGAVEEAPMGLFDVARGAAAAFSKSAFPLRGNGQRPQMQGSRHDTQAGMDQSTSSLDMSDSGSIHSGTEDRVRRRDMVASAVTGGLASGIGWVLGAKPVNDQEHE